MPEQPPNENGASYHEDRQCTEAPSDPPLSNEKTELLLEEREHRDTEYATPVHIMSLPARSKVKKRGNFLFDFTSLPNVFRLNRGNIFAVPCGLLFCVHLRSNQASQLLRCTHGNKRKPQRCPSSHPSVIYRDRGNRRRSEVTEILRPAAGRRSTVKHAASGTRSEIQIRNGRAFQEALSGF